MNTYIQRFVLHHTVIMQLLPKYMDNSIEKKKLRLVHNLKIYCEKGLLIYNQSASLYKWEMLEGA